MPHRTDALSLLKADHENVKELLAQLEKSTERSASKRETLLAQIETEVTIHTTIEEEIFYPAYRDAVSSKEDRKLFQEALEEHHVVDMVLPELKRADPASEVFSAKAKVLKDLIEHHADEEEKEMFRRARSAMDTSELKELGERMIARKEELMAELESSMEAGGTGKSRSGGHGKHKQAAAGHHRTSGRSQPREHTVH